MLVGPNAAGKTTFLDVVAFLGTLVSEGLETAVLKRTSTFDDLLFGRTGDRFELAIEARIPAERRNQLAVPAFDRVRYEVAVGLAPGTAEISILGETVLLKRGGSPRGQQRSLFPSPGSPPSTILTSRKPGNRSIRTVISKVPGGNDNFYSESYQESGKGWAPAFKLGPRKSALGNLPEDESKFPVSTWLKQLLAQGVQQFILNSLLIRRASPPGQVKGFKPDGSNLPWVIESLKNTNDARFKAWIDHLRTALPDIEDVYTVERKDDKHRYCVIRYAGGFDVPSWMASDGTLRMMALTLPAYLPEFAGVYLIEEPENGIHPRAVETLFQSLSSVYNAQILMATHSPVILSVASAASVLCFAKNSDGSTDVVSGDRHPALRNWKGEENLGVLFAGGVLG